MPHLVLVAPPLATAPPPEPVPAALPHPPATTTPTPPQTTPDTFCARLKSARERRGITLSAIAESTKISPGHLTALERGDVSRWPGGIYRRSFFVSYVEAIGMPVEPAFAEFLRLFPDEHAPAAPAPSGDVAAQAEPLRLSLAGRPYSPNRRTKAAAMEAGLVALIALVAVIALDAAAWPGALVLTAWYGRPTAIRLHRTARGVTRRRRSIARGQEPQSAGTST